MVRRVQPVERRGLETLPDVLLIKILILVAGNNFADFRKARMTCKTMKRISSDHGFLRSFDLFSNHIPGKLEAYMVGFLIACAEARNPKALFLKGISLFSYDFHRRPHEGVELIKSAARSGIEFARYAFEILRKGMWGPAANDNEFAELSHTEARRIRREINQFSGLALFGGEDYDSLADYVRDELDDINLEFLPDCPCDWHDPNVPWWVEGVKGPNMCDACFWKIEILCFFRIVPQKFGIFF